MELSKIIQEQEKNLCKYHPDQNAGGCEDCWFSGETKKTIREFSITLIEQIIKKMEGEKMDERKAKFIGKYFVETFESKSLVNAVIEDQISYLLEQLAIIRGNK